MSCGKLTTGVTVPQWSGIFMLRNLNSPETYFQSMFRVQSPWVVKNHDGCSPNEEEIIKPICYVFDFSPNRALSLLAEYTSRIDNNEKSEEKLKEFTRFLPVICYDGSTMQELDAKEILDIVASGTSSTMLARRWESAQLMNVDNETLERLLGKDDVMEALEKITALRNLNDDIRKIISSDKAVKKAKIEKKKIDKKEKKDANEKQKLRKQIREKLIKFVSRIPHFMYLTDYREETMIDVIRNIEPELFETVTGLTVKDFNLLYDLKVFNHSILNSAIFAFRRFEEGSLSYAGRSKITQSIGLFEGNGSGSYNTLA